MPPSSQADRRSCIVVDPHVEQGKPDTTYSMNSLLEAARPGDKLSFVPMRKKAAPGRLQRLARAVLRSASRIEHDPAIEARPPATPNPRLGLW